jgi:hypothetical protein
MFATKSITETTSMANISYVYNMYKNLEIYPPRASGTNAFLHKFRAKLKDSVWDEKEVKWS